MKFFANTFFAQILGIENVSITFLDKSQSRSNENR